MYATQLEEYKTTQKLKDMSGREIEASALMQAAFKIRDCQNNWNAPDRDARLNEALRNNQQIWSILQGELVQEDHPLPKQVREDILRLSIFIDKRTFEVMARSVPEKLTILIEINLNLAAGLNHKPASHSQPVGQVLQMPKKEHVATSFRA